MGTHRQRPSPLNGKARLASFGISHMPGPACALFTLPVPTVQMQMLAGPVEQLYNWIDGQVDGWMDRWKVDRWTDRQVGR